MGAMRFFRHVLFLMALMYLIVGMFGLAITLAFITMFFWLLEGL